MGVAAVVILYHPDESVLQNVQSYLPDVDKLYVADNTEGSLSDVAKQLQKDNKVHLIYDGENEGIARRLNQAARLAIEDDFNWLLTMDQDSSFEEQSIQTYLLCAGSYLHKDNTAMFGVEHEKKNAELIECSPKEVVQLITSGSILNLLLFQQLGNFDENLFIDEVDLEYCYRSIIKGYKVVKFSNVFLFHNLGNLSYHKSLKNLAVTPRVLHSPIRLYYMIRNYFYIDSKYAETFVDNDKYRKKALLNRIKNNLLYGKRKIDTIRYILRAYRDFKGSKMGKLQN